MNGPVERKATSRQLWTALWLMVASLVLVIGVAVYWVAIRPQTQRADGADQRAQVVASQAQTLRSALVTAARVCSTTDTDAALCSSLSSLATQTIAVTPTTSHPEGVTDTVYAPPVTSVETHTRVSIATFSSGYPVFTTVYSTVPVTTTTAFSVRTLPPRPPQVETETETQRATETVFFQVNPETRTLAYTETETAIQTATATATVTTTGPAQTETATKTATETATATKTETVTQTQTDTATVTFATTATATQTETAVVTVTETTTEVPAPVVVTVTVTVSLEPTS